MIITIYRNWKSIAFVYWLPFNTPCGGQYPISLSLELQHISHSRRHLMFSSSSATSYLGVQLSDGKRFSSWALLVRWWCEDHWADGQSPWSNQETSSLWTSQQRRLQKHIHSTSLLYYNMSSQVHHPVAKSFLVTYNRSRYVTPMFDSACVFISTSPNICVRVCVSADFSCAPSPWQCRAVPSSSCLSQSLVTRSSSPSPKTITSSGSTAPSFTVSRSRIVCLFH